MRTIEYMGVEVTYDERCPHNWRWQKAVASQDPARGTRAMERLLCDHDDYYAYRLGGGDLSIEEWDALSDDAQYDLLDTVDAPGQLLGELMGKIMEAEGQDAKN